jgi:hypothetical protein
MAGSSSEMRKGRLLSDSSLAGPFGPSTCAVAHYIHYGQTRHKCQPFPAVFGSEAKWIEVWREE